MNCADSIPLPEELSERQRQALLSLLSDEDPSVYEMVRSRIVAYGPRSVEWLQPHLLSEDPLMRRRAREIAAHFGRQEADLRFLAFCLKQGEDLDLEEGAWLLARTQYPEINVQAYKAMLDECAAELRGRVDADSSPRRILARMNVYLFRELGFCGNEADYYNPDNSYLNCVLDRRTGNPINLCLVYMLVARRLRVPVVGIGLPGHFICRYQGADGEVYIDSFNRGRLLTKADCVQYLLRGNYSLNDENLAPVTPRRMLLRICGNLHQIYAQQEVEEPITRLQRYLVALAK
jgi:regulator of sirC expression with transglutaminase-like and TPR domain